MGPAQARPDDGRGEQHLPFFEFVGVAGVFQMTAAREAYQDTWRFRLTDDERQAPADARRRELIAMDEPLAQHRPPLEHSRDQGRDGPLLEIYARDGLLHLQSAWLRGLGIDVIPVIETKGHIAVLLQFEH